MTGWIHPVSTGAYLGARGPHPVTVIGYDGSALEPAAAAALARADVVVGGRRHLAALPLPEGADQVVLGALDPALEEVERARDAGRQVAVLASGDPGFFGIVRRLSRGGGPVVVHPARSSVAMACARLGVPWDDAIVVSAHGRDVRPAVNVLRRFGAGHSHQAVVVLTDADSGPAALIRELGDDFAGFHVLERVGLDGECVTTVDPRLTEVDEHGHLPTADALRRDWDALTLLVAVTPFREHVAPWLAGRPVTAGWALPDDAFAHRDRMLTKREVRAVALARLAPAVGTLVWDVGAGSGSVAVECSRLGAAVVAVERDPQALQHISANADAHQAPVRVVHGSAPEALDGLPWPDAVFVGGGGPDVVAAVAAVRPTRVVVALATVERVAPTVAALDGYDVDTVLLQASHLQPLGEGSRLAPANPVFLVSGALP